MFNVVLATMTQDGEDIQFGDVQPDTLTEVESEP